MKRPEKGMSKALRQIIHFLILIESVLDVAIFLIIYFQWVCETRVQHGQLNCERTRIARRERERKVIFPVSGAESELLHCRAELFLLICIKKKNFQLSMLIHSQAKRDRPAIIISIVKSTKLSSKRDGRNSNWRLTNAHTHVREPRTGLNVIFFFRYRKPVPNIQHWKYIHCLDFDMSASTRARVAGQFWDNENFNF